MIKRFTVVNTKDADLNSVQRNVDDALTPIIRNPLLDGRMIEKVRLTAANPTLVEHKLGRQVLGWVIVDIDSNANVWKTPTNNINFLQLETSADCTVNIYVF